MEGECTVTTEHQSASKEPGLLRSGKAFHNLVQRFYEYQSRFEHEKTLYKVTNRRGRMDLFLWVDNQEDYAVVMEIKNTDWDRLSRRNSVRRNLRSHINQVWSYLEGSLMAERIGSKRTEDCGAREARRELDAVERSAGIVYPKTPEAPGLKEAIETELGEWGISAVWFDQPPPEGSLAWHAWQAMQEGSL